MLQLEGMKTKVLVISREHRIKRVKVIVRD